MSTSRTVFNLDDPQVEFNRIQDSTGQTSTENRLQQVQSILKQYSQETENKPPVQQKVWSNTPKPSALQAESGETLRRLDAMERNLRQLSDIVSLLVDLRTR